MSETENFGQSHTTNRLLSLARVSYLIGVVLALVVSVPTAWFPLQLGKIALMATLLAVSGVSFVLGGGLRELTGRRGLLLSLTSALLPLAYLVSFYFSTDRSVGLTGSGFEADTVLFAAFGFVALLLGFALFRTERQARSLFSVVFFSLIAAAVFQCVAVLFGTSALPFQTFADRSANLIGKWNDLGLLLGLLGVWCVGLMEWLPLSVVRRGALLVILVLLAALLGLVHFDLVWELMLGGCVILGAVAYLTRKPGNESSAMTRVPWYASTMAVVCVLFILFGSSINTGLTKLLPVSSLEVRPSYSSTLQVVQLSHQGLKQALFGTGPNTFGEAWLLHKPDGVNASVFWSLDFVVGFSTFLTAFAGVGLVGMLGWAIPFLLALLGLLRVLRSEGRSGEERLLAGALGIGSLYLWISAALYAPSQNVLLLAFVLTGALLSLAYMAHGSQMQEGGRLSRGVLGLVIVVIVLGVGFHADQRFIQQSYVNQGIVALGAGDNKGALDLALKAQQYGVSADAYRLEAQVGLATMQQIQSSTNKPTPEVQQAFTQAASTTILAGQRAVAASQRDYRSYVVLGQAYDLLSALNVQNAYQMAEKTYYDAAGLNSSNPQIPLLLARVEANHNNLQLTQAFLQKSLTLKPNYTDAILFAVQLYVAQKDLPNAIAAAKAAVQSAPGVPSIWFELGLLYYAGGDTKDAIDPLQKAITIQSDYANAKYFLGLSEYAQGQVQAAMALFTDLKSSNPDNTEVALILSNMQAGKPPFTSAQPPVTAHPETRATAPVSE